MIERLSFVLFAGGAASVGVSLIALVGRLVLGLAPRLAAAHVQGVALAVPGGTLHLEGRPSRARGPRALAGDPGVLSGSLGVRPAPGACRGPLSAGRPRARTP